MNTKHDGRTCLSIQQPWAWLIVNGYKDIENRTWRTPYRGPLYIHAGRKFDAEGYEMVKEKFPHIQLPARADFKFGGIVGKAIVRECTVGDNASPWAVWGACHWKLTDAEPIPFEPMKGRLGLFRAGDAARVVELPEGFILRTNKNCGGFGFDATLYRGTELHTATIEGTYFGDTREEAVSKAIARAHHLHALPGLETLTAPCHCTEHHE